jgi:hypothetical protein
MNTQEQDIKVYSIFNASGKMEELTPAGPLPVNCKLYFFGPYGADSYGAVISEPDERGQQKAVIFNSSEDGKPFFMPVDKYARPTSKKFGIGLYYFDTLETHPAELVAEYTEKAEQAQRDRLQAINDKEQQDREEIAKLPALFPHLTPIDKGGDAANNLRAELKKRFPGVKFSVKKEHYNTYYIRWENGPTAGEVSKIGNMFESYESDFTGDYRDFNPSNFNRVFGGFKYVFESRKASEDLEKLLNDEINKDLDQGREYWKQFNNTDLTHAVNIRIEDNQLIFNYQPKETPQAVEIVPESVQLVDYSNKALAIIGDTKEIKEVLKSLGGRFNPRLTCGAGWIFPKTKEAQIKQALNL